MYPPVHATGYLCMSDAGLEEFLLNPPVRSPKLFLLYSKQEKGHRNSLFLSIKLEEVRNHSLIPYPHVLFRHIYFQQIQ